MHRILFTLAALLILAGCARKQIVIEPPVPAEPTADWQYVPAPPAPPMFWVTAGPYSKGQRTAADIDAIIIHTTEGRFVEENNHVDNQNRAFRGNINYFKGNDRNVSAHFVMGPNGEIAHMVSETDVAHTQTYYNGRGIGIECAGWGGRPETWTPELVDSLVELVAYLCVKWEVPAYQPEGTAYEGPWSVTLEDDVKRFVAPGIVGHYQVQPWNKSDPGPHFDWDGFTERVRERIRKYGVEPIPLPDPQTELAKLTWVNAKIKEETIRVGQPFTYRLTIVGEGARALTADSIQFPDLSVEPHIKMNGTPTRVESSANRVVFEIPLVASEAKNANLTASRVTLEGNVQSSGTTRVRFAEQ